jgi:hypothetical protein
MERKASTPVGSRRGRSTAAMHRGRRTAAMMVRFLPILVMVGFTFAMMPEAGCGHGVFPEVTISTTPTAVPVPTTVPSTSPTATSSATPATALGTSFNMRGSSTQTGSTSGTCSGEICTATGHLCECTTFKGTVSSTLGTLDWTAQVTLNLSDCTSTGTAAGSCCNGDGTFTATDGKSGDSLVLAFTGPDCLDPTASSATSVEANFAVLPTSSTGKFANSTGTGQFNLFADSSDGSGYVSVLGQILVGGK